jgi:hypothetical protein
VLDLSLSSRRLGCPFGLNCRHRPNDPIALAPLAVS